MSGNDEQEITHILARGKSIKSLVHRVNSLKILQTILLKCLPENVSHHCQVANITEGQLVIMVDSANWATQIRFNMGDLLQKLRQHAPLYSLKHISCIVRPPVGPAIRPTNVRTVAKMTPNTAQLIVEAAEAIADPKLKQQLISIAKNIKR